MTFKKKLCLVYLLSMALATGGYADCLCVPGPQGPQGISPTGDPGPTGNTGPSGAPAATGPQGALVFTLPCPVNLIIGSALMLEMTPVMQEDFMYTSSSTVLMVTFNPAPGLDIATATIVATAGNDSGMIVNVTITSRIGNVVTFTTDEPADFIEFQVFNFNCLN